METLISPKNDEATAFSLYEVYPNLPSELMSDVLRSGEEDAISDEERLRVVGRYLVISSLGLIDQKGRMTSVEVLTDIARSKTDEESFMNKIMLQRGDNMHDEDTKDFTEQEVQQSLISLDLGFDIFEGGFSKDDKKDVNGEGIPEDIGEEEMIEAAVLEAELLED